MKPFYTFRRGQRRIDKRNFSSTFDIYYDEIYVIRNNNFDTKSINL